MTFKMPMKIKWIFAKCGFLWHLKCEMTFKMSMKIKWIFAKCGWTNLLKNVFKMKHEILTEKIVDGKYI